MKKINVGLVGYGFSGVVFHAPLLSVLDEFTLLKVVSSNPEKVKSDLGDVAVVKELDELLADKDIDLVIITTPSGLHFDMAKKSLLAGKHVVLEKPMVVTTKEAEELIQLAKEKQVQLSVYHNRRWDNDFLTIKQLIETGDLGEINTYESHFDRFRPSVRDRWRENNVSGSGTLYDLGSHLIDQALHLFGMPDFVSADVFGQRENAQTDDYFHLVLGYEKRRVILHSATIVPSSGPRFQVHGSKGSFIKYGLDSQEEMLKAGQKPVDDSWGADDACFYGELVTSEGTKRTVETVNGSYLTYYKKIADSLLHGKELPVTAEEGLNVIRVIEAAFKSSKEKKVIYL
ncbi:oxidoreductase [Priestia megaterium]|nr:oxidoreductase [Priestia megaterium]